MKPVKPIQYKIFLALRLFTFIYFFYLGVREAKSPFTAFIGTIEFDLVTIPGFVVSFVHVFIIHMCILLIIVSVLKVFLLRAELGTFKDVWDSFEQEERRKK